MDYMIFGLGNPGPQYADNRHNIGQHVVQYIASSLGANLSVHKGGSLAAGVRLTAGNRLILAKSQGYMNLSGAPVSFLAQYYKIDAANIIVVHDELDVPFGQLKVKIGGGDGGHNGLKDITKALSTPNYHRVRVGIGRPPGRMPVKNFVLQNFSATERTGLDRVIGAAAEACDLIITRDLLHTQQTYHGKDLLT